MLLRATSEGERVAKAQLERKAEGLYKEHLSQFLKSLIKIPYSKLCLITIRDPKQGKTMNMIRKWLSKFSKLYMVVQSPTNGIHYHALVRMDKNPPYLRGCCHIHKQMLGGERPQFIPSMPSLLNIFGERHPIIRGDVGYLLMAVNEELRVRFNHSPISLPARIRSRKSALNSLLKKKSSVNNVVNYLLKNYHENQNPKYYSNLYITS